MRFKLNSLRLLALILSLGLINGSCSSSKNSREDGITRSNVLASNDSLPPQLQKIIDSLKEATKAEGELYYSEAAIERAKKTRGGDFNLREYFFDQQKQFLTELKAKEEGFFELNELDLFLETGTPDNLFGAKCRKVVNDTVVFPDYLLLGTGDTLRIKFGTSESDNLIAKQTVTPLLLEGLNEIFTNANRQFEIQQMPKIRSIKIMCTKNGKHSDCSNHFHGEAVDISAIDGVKLIFMKYSLMKNLSDSEQVKLHNELKDLNLEWDLLYERILTLQIWMERYPSRRENFGPIFKTKFSTEITNASERFDFDYEIGGHQDHIHFSVRPL